MIVNKKSTKKNYDFIIIESDVEEVKLIDLEPSKLLIGSVVSSDISDLIKNLKFRCDFNLYEETDYSNYTTYTTIKETDYYYSEYSKQKNFFKKDSIINITRVSSKTFDLSVYDCVSKVTYNYYGVDRFPSFENPYGTYSDKNQIIDFVYYIFKTCEIVNDDKNLDYIKEFLLILDFHNSNCNQKTKLNVYKSFDNFIKNKKAKNNSIKIRLISNKALSVDAIKLFNFYINLH